MDKNQFELTNTTIFDNIKLLIDNIIIKMSNEANRYDDDIDTYRLAERYVAAKREVDSFSSHETYEADIVMKAGITDVDFAMECERDKYKIPYNKRNLVLKYKREQIINEYVEENNYYRELIGLPPIETPEDDFIYLTKSQMKYYGIDEVRPLHDYPKEIIAKLENTLLPKLINRYPDKTYLKRMGSNAVDLVKARTAKNFEIIYCGVEIDYLFMRKFFETYSFCREYFMTVIYNNNFRQLYELYDNYIAMNIMIMTIQRMIVDTIKSSIDRDFFDLILVKKLFACYGVPFFQTLPMDYQRIIVKHLNMLIRTKSTDRCLYDIANTLMYERLNVYKYFLVKERLLDENGNPIIATKTKYDDEGNVYTVPDYEKMYDIYFQSTDIMEQNVILSIENKTNRYEYKEVTEEDDLWWEDGDLQKELYERDFNFIDTKYIGLTTQYNLTKMLQESIYFLNMLIDKKEKHIDINDRLLNSDAMYCGTDHIYLTLDRIANFPISIFDAIIILCVLLAKKNHMRGNILIKPAQIMSVLGFDFETNFDLIRNNIKNDPYIFKNPEITKYLDLLDIYKVEDIDTLYNNFINLKDFCVKRMNETTNIREFRAYEDIYRTIMIKDETTKAFTMSNGAVAKTYNEYLRDKLPYISDYIETLDSESTGVLIEHILGKLNELIPDLTYVNSLNGVNNNIVNAIIDLIGFFKSYTVDLRNLNVIFMFDDDYWNRIRMISDPRLFVKIFPREKPEEYNDISKVYNKYDFKEKINLSRLYDLDIDNQAERPQWFNNIRTLTKTYDSKIKIKNNLDMKETIKIYYE